MAQNAHYPVFFWLFLFQKPFFLISGSQNLFTNQHDSWLMSFQGYVAHFGSVIWEKNKSRPRRRTKQAKQAKHISQMGRHRNHPLGAGACLWRCFFEATDWCVNFWNQLIGPPSTKELVFKYKGVKNSFFGGDGVWFEVQIRHFFHAKNHPIEVFVEYFCLRDSSVDGWLSQCLMNTNMCNRNMLGGCYYVLCQTSTFIHSTN